MKTSLVSAPATLPVSLSDAKEHLRVTESADDEYVNGLLSAATSHAEQVLGRKLITQTHRAHLDGWPAGVAVLPFGKLQSVSSMTYKDESGITATVDDDDYVVDIVSDPGSVSLAAGAAWPGSTLYSINPITIEFVCGYGAAVDVPAPIRHAIKFLVSHWYENREIVVVGTSVDMAAVLPTTVDALLMPYRLWAF